MSNHNCMQYGCDKEAQPSTDEDWYPYCKDHGHENRELWGMCAATGCWRWRTLDNRCCAQHDGEDYLHGSHEEHAAAQAAKPVPLVARVNLHHQGQTVTSDAVEGVLLRGPATDRAPSDPLSDLTEAAEEAGEALALAQEEHALVALLVHARAMTVQGRWAQALADLYRVRGDAVRCRRLALWCAVRDFARAAETKAEGGQEVSTNNADRCPAHKNSAEIDDTCHECEDLFDASKGACDECGAAGAPPCPGCGERFCQRCAERPYEFCACFDEGGEK